MTEINKETLSNTEYEFSRDESILKIVKYIDNKDQTKLNIYISELHNADIADILQNLDPDLRTTLVKNISINLLV